MDLTIEAIEQDLMNAEARAGQPIAAVYLKRAEIRATLMAMPQQIEAVFVEAEPEDDLDAEQAVYEEHVEQQNVAFDELDDETEDDFFAEAKRERKK